jgi:hypothetical protein
MISAAADFAAQRQHPQVFVNCQKSARRGFSQSIGGRGPKTCGAESYRAGRASAGPKQAPAEYFEESSFQVF